MIEPEEKRVERPEERRGASPLRLWFWPLIAGGLIFVLLFALGGLALLPGSTNILFQHTYALTSEPHLVITDAVGSLSVQSGKSNNV